MTTSPATLTGAEFPPPPRTLPSAECREVTKPCSIQIWRRTAARVSEKVGRLLRYQAVAETVRVNVVAALVS
jgi:hypothetical protein